MSQAVIHVVYQLSPEGERAALAAGKNASRHQIIYLRHPDYVAPPITPSIAALTEAVVATTEAVRRAPTTELAQAAKALAESAKVLAKALEPSVQQDVTTEVADTDLWALAVSMAESDGKGHFGILVRSDTQNGDWIEGIDVDYDYHRGIATYKDRVCHEHFDGLYTAAQLLPPERDRLAALKQMKLDARSIGAAREEAEKVKRLEGALNMALGDARAFLQDAENFRHLPEVRRVQELVDAGDRESLHAFGDWSHMPLKAARDAVRQAKET